MKIRSCRLKVIICEGSTTVFACYPLLDKDFFEGFIQAGSYLIEYAFSFIDKVTFVVLAQVVYKVLLVRAD